MVDGLGNNTLYVCIWKHSKTLFLGIACGHLYYFLEDVFPNQPYGFHILETPTILKRIFNPAPMPYVEVDERPGGYNWGAERPQNEEASSDEDDDVVVVQ